MANEATETLQLEEFVSDLLAFVTVWETFSDYLLTELAQVYNNPFDLMAYYEDSVINEYDSNMMSSTEEEEEGEEEEEEDFSTDQYSNYADTNQDMESDMESNSTFDDLPFIEEYEDYYNDEYDGNFNQDLYVFSDYTVGDSSSEEEPTTDEVYNSDTCSDTCSEIDF